MNTPELAGPPWDNVLSFHRNCGSLILACDVQESDPPSTSALPQQSQPSTSQQSGPGGVIGLVDRQQGPVGGGEAAYGGALPPGVPPPLGGNPLTGFVATSTSEQLDHRQPGTAQQGAPCLLQCLGCTYEKAASWSCYGHVLLVPCAICFDVACSPKCHVRLDASVLEEPLRRSLSLDHWPVRLALATVCRCLIQHADCPQKLESRQLKQ